MSTPRRGGAPAGYTLRYAGRAALAIALVVAVAVPVMLRLRGSAGVPAAALATTPITAAPATAVRTAATLTPSPKAPLTADASLDVQVTGVGGVPEQGVDAVVLTITAVAASAETFLTVWPTGDARPVASSLNPGPGRTVANTVVARVGPDGKVSIYNRAGRAHVVVDVLGWLAAGGGMHTQTPARVYDSRTAAALATAATVAVPVVGKAGVPADAKAVVVNLTATDATAASYVTAWPTGSPRPFASNLNPAPGRTVANLAVVPLGADGSISLFNNAGSVQLIVDVLGWLGAGGGYVGAVPTRLYDSRASGGGPVGADASIDVSIGALPAAGDPVPVAAIANVTATGATADTYLVTWPAGGERPTTSSLNPGPGPAQANTVIVGLGTGAPGTGAPGTGAPGTGAPGTGRSISVYNHAGKVDVVVDLLGALTAESGIHPLAPARLFDTRPPDVPHAFPVSLAVKPAPSYVHDHHDYPATDVFADCGSPVLSPVDGVIVHVRRTDSYVASVGNPATLGGRSIAVLGDDGVRYYGSHLESFVDGITVGLRVKAGQPIAVLGRTGDAGACHLHFGISPPCPGGPEWQVRRGVIWPGDYLDSWRAGGNLGPADEIAAWVAAHPKACADAQALPTAPQSEDPPG